MEFIELRCPNRPQQDSSFECRKELAGPSLDAILAHDWSRGDFVDLRYCSACNSFVEVTITEKGSLGYRILGREERVSFTPATDAFKRITVKGVRVKHVRD
jgi:hypothetical protein